MRGVYIRQADHQLSTNISEKETYKDVNTQPFFPDTFHGALSHLVELYKVWVVKRRERAGED